MTRVGVGSPPGLDLSRLSHLNATGSKRTLRRAALGVAVASTTVVSLSALTSFWLWLWPTSGTTDLVPALAPYLFVPGVILALVGLWAASMIFMVHLNQRKAQLALRLSYRELERKVVARSRELAAANAALMKEIAVREEREAALFKAKEEAEIASRAKSTFVAHMSHELRSPLGVILGFCDLALESVNAGSDAANSFRTIRRSGELLLSLVEEVLDLSKVEAGRLEICLEDVNLVGLLDELKSTLGFKANEKGISLRIESVGAVPQMIRTDPLRLRQILLNIVGNAVKFTDQGQVSLRIWTLSDSNEVGEATQLKFEVSDTGVGIAPDHRPRLFQAFSQADPSTTRKYGGTGLGLILSRKLAHALGGRLELIQSEIGKGSTFALVVDVGVPASATTLVSLEAAGCGSLTVVEEGSAAMTPPRKPLCDVKVLVVEDAPDIQILVARYLSLSGAVVDVACDGKEGMTKAMSGDFDVLLMDLSMPIMSGREATTELRKCGYVKPIIALTAHAMREERELSLKCGFSAYLTKPVERQTLVDTIRRQLSVAH